MAISTAHTNAELIAECAQLGYLREEWRTLDPTYGGGKFWTKWRPTTLVRTDLAPAKSPDLPGGLDFRRLAELEVLRTNPFDAIVFDPPYKLNGTSTGRGPAMLDSLYGVEGQYVSWQGKHQLIREGITSCVNVLAPRGMLLVKCQDQVCSGQVRWQTREFTDHAESLGCKLVDMLHLQGGRKQPPGRRQLHASRNYSTMLVFQGPK